MDTQERTALAESFAQTSIPMTWDFAEANPFARCSWRIWIARHRMASRSALRCAPATVSGGFAQSSRCADSDHHAVASHLHRPPYYDNIGYADLSDFFYVWLRRSLRSVFPRPLATIAVPKAEELVATPYRHGGKEKAEEFFLEWHDAGDATAWLNRRTRHSQ